MELRIGPALDSLRALTESGEPPFDLTFLDADKPPSVEYFEPALRLSHPGSLIVVDNVVPVGAIAAAGRDDPAIRGMRRLFERMREEPRVRATALQTVGSKEYDGFLLAVVVDPKAPEPGRPDPRR